MNARMIIVAGCLLATGLLACDQKNEEPATVDTTTAMPVDTITMGADTVSGTPVDTQLLNRVDTAIILQDTMIKEGQPATTGSAKKSTATKSTAGKKSTSETGSAPAVENETVGAKPRGGAVDNEPVGAKPRGGAVDNEPVGAKPRH